MRLLCDALARSIQAGALYEGGPSFAAGSANELFCFKTRLDMAFRGAGSDAFGPTDTRAPPTRIPAVGLPAYLLIQVGYRVSAHRISRVLWSSPLSAVEKVFFILKYAQKTHPSEYRNVFYDLIAQEDSVKCFYGCDTAVHGLPVPPWMVMLGHFVDALYLVPEKHFTGSTLDVIVPPEARPSTTITFIDSPTTPVDMDAVKKMVDESVVAKIEERHILSIDYGEY